jgi:hypothetical protein
MRMSTTAKTFTADEFYRLDELGFFEDDRRLELLEGQIVYRCEDVGPEHLSVVARMTEKFVIALGNRANVFPQVSLRLTATSVPMPDIYLAHRREDYYRAGGPSIEQLVAVIEVAHTSLVIDRGEKLRTYARARVSEYWIANLRDWTIEKHLLPNDLGFGEVRPYSGRGLFAFEAFPATTFTVDDLLGPQTQA